MCVCVFCVVLCACERQRWWNLSGALEKWNKKYATYLTNPQPLLELPLDTWGLAVSSLCHFYSLVWTLDISNKKCTLQPRRQCVCLTNFISRSPSNLKCHETFSKTKTRRLRFPLRCHFNVTCLIVCVISNF